MAAAAKQSELAVYRRCGSVQPFKEAMATFPYPRMYVRMECNNDC